MTDRVRMTDKGGNQKPNVSFWGTNAETVKPCENGRVPKNLPLWNSQGISQGREWSEWLCIVVRRFFTPSHSDYKIQYNLSIITLLWDLGVQNDRLGNFAMVLPDPSVVPPSGWQIGERIVMMRFFANAQNERLGGRVTIIGEKMTNQRVILRNRRAEGFAFHKWLCSEESAMIRSEVRCGAGILRSCLAQNDR